MPTWPRPSPTATSAVNENRRPPFTTLATRLMVMTRSSKPSPPRWFPSLKLKAGLPGCIGQGCDPAVVEESAAVEHDLRDAGCLCPLPEELADLLGGVPVATGGA